MAGCQSSTRTNEMTADSSTQIAAACQVFNPCAARDNFTCIRHARTAIAPRMRSAKTHFGHDPRRTSWPFEYIAAGYLKRNSNIYAATRERRGPTLSYFGF